jgi:hypothetical protein
LTASTAYVFPLDQRRLPTGLSQRGREGAAGLAGADDNGIIFLGHHRQFPFLSIKA